MKHKIGNIVSWIMLIVAFLFLSVSVYSIYQSKINGTDAYAFGYRPIFVMTGSMEPTLKTNGTVIAKKVSSMDEIEVGDIITYHVLTDQEEEIKITHRITEISDTGIITTKGDNNGVEDRYELTIDNVESKVVLICNWTAWFVNLWGTPSGKILLIGVPVCLLLFIIGLKYLFRKESS